MTVETHLVGDSGVGPDDRLLDHHMHRLVGELVWHHRQTCLQFIKLLIGKGAF